MRHPAFGDKLFSFAVVADTHLNQDDANTNSPFKVNELANRRLRHVISDLNSRELSHVIHLGDVVHPVPSGKNLYEDAAQKFHEQINELRHPLYIIPGNHDVGDKPIAWGPAGTVCQSFLDAWSEYFGEHYFHFSCKGVSFIGLNIQLYGSNLPLESNQRNWLAGILKENSGDRIMLFSHYPPYLFHPDEDEHYDNLGKEGRLEILELIQSNSVEALFAGHVHHFWYHFYEGCNFYLLPSTAFTRQDYSEMFRVPSQDSFGRNDICKLGYLIVHVYEKGHEFELIRSFGQEQGAYPLKKTAGERIHPVTPQFNLFPAMGFDLRYDWQEQTQIPPLGSLDEFDRKTVRNDYGMLALWEMGAKHLRVPPADLLDPVRRQRLHDLVNLGFQFTLFSSASTAEEISNLVFEHSRLFRNWEISGYLDHCMSAGQQLSSGLQQKGIRLFMSLIRSKADILRTGSTYYHVINHGFRSTDSNEELLKYVEPLIKSFDGVIFRCGIGDSITNTVHKAKFVAQETGLDVSVHLRLSSDNPAEYLHSEPALCNQLALAMCYGWCEDFCQFYCDTLADSDRGFFPRKGVLDREYNPKFGALLVKNLHSVFSKLGRARHWEVKQANSKLTTFRVVAESGELSVFHFEGGSRGSDDCIQSREDGYWLDWTEGKFVTKAPQMNGYPLVHVCF